MEFKNKLNTVKIMVVCYECKTNYGDYSSRIDFHSWVYCPKCGQKELYLTENKKGD